MSSDSIQQLQRYFSQGDEKAFASVVTEYLPLVFSVAVRITRHRSLSEEISQIVFSRLAGLRHGLPPGVSLATWLHRTTRTAALNAIRAEQRRQRREEAAATFAMNESRFPWEQISPVLDEVIEKLPRQDRELILSRFFLGESSEELASRLNLGSEAMKKRLQRALARLRDQLGRRGIHTTTAALSLSLPVYGVESAGLALPASTIAGAATASPVAPSAFNTFATLVMKQSVPLSTLAILAAGSVWIGAQVRAAAALEDRLGNLRQRISAAGSGSSSAQAGNTRPGGRGTPGQGIASIDWQRFVEIRRESGDNLLLAKLGEEMRRNLAAMNEEQLAAELERLEALPLKDEDHLDLEKLLLGFLTAKNPVRTLHHLEDRLADDRLTPEGFMAFDKWLKLDSAAAVQWLDAQAAAGKFEMKTLRSENPTRKWMEGMLLPLLLSRDASTAIERLMTLPPDQRRGVFAVAEVRPGTETAAAQAIVATVPEQERGPLLEDLTRRLAAQGLEKIGEFLSGSGVSGQDLSSIVAGAFNNSLSAATSDSDYANRLQSARDFARQHDSASVANLTGYALAARAIDGHYEEAAALLADPQSGTLDSSTVAAFLQFPGLAEKFPQVRDLLPNIPDTNERERIRAALDANAAGDAGH